MVAGATGLDLVMLVIAADEGVMPQTREHLDICDLLGVRRGLIVLTKRDLVDDEWLAMVTADVAAAVAGTFLADAPIVPVSTKTGVGHRRAARATLARVIDALPPRTTTGVFRLPVDRVFTVKGFGTIVTGTVLGGEVALGDELTRDPERARRRACAASRSTARAVERAVAGHRAALNLGGVAVEDLARGDLLAHPGPRRGLAHPRRRAALPARRRPGRCRARSKVLVHHATAQVLATLVLVERDRARARRDRARAAAARSRRRRSARCPAITSSCAASSRRATARLDDRRRPDHPRARAEGAQGRAARRRPSRRSRPRASISASRSTSQTAAAAGLAHRRAGAPARRCRPTALAEPLATLVAGGELLAPSASTHYLHAHGGRRARGRRSRALVGAPTGISREELRTQLPAALPARAYDAILAGLERARRSSRPTAIASRKQPRRRPPALSPVETAVLAKLEATGVEPPRPKELPAALGLAEAQVKAALDRLVAAKLVVKVKPDLVDARDGRRRRSASKLSRSSTQHGTIDAQQWKELTGASRKFTIPLAEYFDAEKLTLRVGDVRRLSAPQKK